MRRKEQSFYQKVYEVVRLIPKGRVSSYGAIANYLGTRGSSRMVGWALNQCHTVSPIVPAQRVVNRNGVLTGKHHFGGANMMKDLLESEGISVVDNTVSDFEELFWDPSVELR